MEGGREGGGERVEVREGGREGGKHTLLVSYNEVPKDSKDMNTIQPAYT